MADMNTNKITLLIPARSADEKLSRCLRSVRAGTMVPKVIVLDLSTQDQTAERIRRDDPEITVFRMGMNPGRAHALNTGFHIAVTPFVMTLDPCMRVGKHCVEELYRAIREDEAVFSVQAAILTEEDGVPVKEAGWRQNFAGEPYVMKYKGKQARRVGMIHTTAACQIDAAMYRAEALETTGILDERYYGMLEDADLGIRARREGYRNLYVPGAVCMRQENTVPSRFREQLEIGNLEYFRYKNRSIGQLAGRPYLAVIQRLRSRKAERAGLGETREAALQRGRMMCFQAEMELMERTELGMSVTKQTLCEEFCMEVKDENLRRVYPLYLGERPDH